MYIYYSAKEKIKILRWQARRAAVARRYSKHVLGNMPVVVGNAIPKSGSHLINQLLSGLPKIGPFVVTGFPPVNRWEDNRKLSPERTLSNIQRLMPGDIGYGYLHCTPPFTAVLTRPGMASIFVYRDPRDVVVSAVKYGAYMNPNHPLHTYYWKHLKTDEERYNAIIQGIDKPGYEYSSIRRRYDSYLGWLDQPGVLCLRFEDLTTEQEVSLNRILDHLSKNGFSHSISRYEAVAALARNLDPQRSGTFRKGEPGSWAHNFTELNKDTFKRVAGDLLLQLGYEKDHDW